MSMIIDVLDFGPKYEIVGKIVIHFSKKFIYILEEMRNSWILEKSSKHVVDMLGECCGTNS